jgi:hypothetical protein
MGSRVRILVSLILDWLVIGCGGCVIEIIFGMFLRRGVWVLVDSGWFC